MKMYRCTGISLGMWNHSYLCIHTYNFQCNRFRKLLYNRQSNQNHKMKCNLKNIHYRRMSN